MESGELQFGAAAFSKKEQVRLDKQTAKLLKLKPTVSGDGFAVVGRRDDNVTEIVIPDTYKGQPIVAIDDYAFKNCTSLVSVMIPNNVKSIGVGVFSGCYNLQNVVFFDSITSIGAYAFYQCGALTSITIGYNVARIGDSAFSACSSLKRVYCQGNIGFKYRIEIGSFNSNLINATWHYYSEEPPKQGGDYWHYVNGVPTKWE